MDSVEVSVVEWYSRTVNASHMNPFLITDGSHCVLKCMCCQKVSKSWCLCQIWTLFKRVLRKSNDFGHSVIDFVPKNKVKMLR